MTVLKITPSPMKHFSRATWLVGFLLYTSGQLHAQGSAANSLPPGDGKDLVAVACTQCHGANSMTKVRNGPAGWKSIVQDMIMRGAQLLPEEADTAIQYLAKNFAPGSAPVKSATSSPAQTGGAEGEKAVSLPAGAGKELVESQCTLCHDLEKITTRRSSKEEWESIVMNMAAQGLTVTPVEIQTIVSYFTAQFGKKAE
ncbi:MAG: hypothetical protein A3G20_02485 [Acidobacteria bacterium RIFCSPLOWO2_12_FULL_59_11]|nr:MAG: hypothetical protein A3G20_02485 [Acidobacteria bacterium RIFCSPLOWO2_12_FULL_59_11]